jgi:hypothetical protein
LSLGRPEDLQFEERVKDWLRLTLGEEPEFKSSSWPPHIAWLEAELERAPPHGLALDAFAQPLDALCALTEALTLSLVVEASPGRYRLA